MTCPSPRKRSKKVTHSNPLQKKKSRNTNNNGDVGLNVPDLIGCNSQEKSASLPLVQGSASQSQDQDSQVYDNSSSSFEMGGSAHKVGRYSLGNEDESKEMLQGSRKVLNCSSPVSVPGFNDRS